VAKGEVVIRVDGHCEIESDYASRCVQHLRVAKVQVVVDHLIRSGKRSLPGPCHRDELAVRGRKLLLPYQEERYDAHRYGGLSGLHARGNRRCRPFDEELVRNQTMSTTSVCGNEGQDTVSQRRSSPILCSIEFSLLWNQFFQYGYWKVRVMQKTCLADERSPLVTPIFALT